MTTYILASGNSVPAALAVESIQDYLGDDGFATVVTAFGKCAWAGIVADTLGLESTEKEPEYTKNDVVIGPTDEDLVKGVTASGAVYLAVDEGLVPLEVSEDEAPAETPDTDNVPEIPVAKKEPAKKAPAKKAPAARKPLARPPAAAKPEKVEEPAEPAQAAMAVAEHVTTTTRATTTRATGTGTVLPQEVMALRDLVSALLADSTDADVLWKVAAGLRGSK